MDARLIGAVTPVDVVGSMSRGNALAQETNALRMQNDLANLYRTQGAALLRGDEGAYNALAGIDAGLAFDMKAKRQDMTYNQRRFEILNAQEARAIADASRQMDEAQRAAALESTKREVFRFLAAPDAATFDQMVTQAGKPELVGQFENRRVLAADYVSSVEEALKLGAGPEAPEWREATPEEAARYGAAAGQISTKTGKFQPFNPPSSTAIRTNADGTTEIVQGPNAKFTEAQSKDNVFATRAKGALSQLEQPLDPNNPSAGVFADALSGFQDSTMNRLPLVGNYLTTDNFQVARTAGDEFLQAILRKDTGAAITPAEQELYGGTYLPQPGDGDARLAYKREARARAVAAIEAGMSQAQLEAIARADAAALSQIQEPNGAPAAQPAPAAPTGNVGGINWRIVE